MESVKKDLFCEDGILQTGVLKSTPIWAEVTLDFLLNYEKVTTIRQAIERMKGLEPLKVHNYFGQRLDLKHYDLLKQIILG